MNTQKLQNNVVRATMLYNIENNAKNKMLLFVTQTFSYTRNTL
jgi:hypothetical protein